MFVDGLSVGDTAGRVDERNAWFAGFAAIAAAVSPKGKNAWHADRNATAARFRARRRAP
ncbi:MAG: hypothetical protein ACLTMP_06110 [Eggerthella lenta]